MNTKPSLLTIAAFSLAAAGMISCSESSSPKVCMVPAGHPQTTAADFPQTPFINNKYYSLVPGTVMKYGATDGKPVEVTVTTMTKTVMGINAMVVHDVVRSTAGELLEDTFDWFAQDKSGNVWYLGEDTKSYAGTMVSTKGSWEAGVNCALPGISMKASPKVGDKYRQEYLKGEAEDESEVISLASPITVPYGSFQNCLQTKDYTALEPGKVEHKWFCEGIGFVSSVDIGTVGTGKREDLVSINGGTGDGGAGDGGTAD